MLDPDDLRERVEEMKNEAEAVFMRGLRTIRKGGKIEDNVNMAARLVDVLDELLEIPWVEE